MKDELGTVRTQTWTCTLVTKNSATVAEFFVCKQSINCGQSEQKRGWLRPFCECLLSS